MDDYEPSDSEQEFTEKEKQLLNKVRSRKKEYSDSEDEVFGVGPDHDDEDDDDEDKSDLALSDVEGQDDDRDLPDIRSWGKDKRKYYSTDYVDPDYGGFQGKDAQLAEQEEEEARNLQKQLAQQLDDDDFCLDVFTTKKTVEDKKQPEEIIKTDISQLSKRQKLQILKKESPEFFGLVEDFEAKMSIAKEYLHPILQEYRKGQIPNCQATDFVQTQYELILNYSTNIYMYLLLKSSKINVRSHPIIKRLYQYRQLLSQLDPVYEEIVKPQLELMLTKREISDQENMEEKVVRQTKTLKLLSTFTQKIKQSSKKKATITEGERPSKKIKVGENVTHSNAERIVHKPDSELKNAHLDSLEDEEEKGEENHKSDEQNEVNKRAITFKMAKNKGLTPHRKKEQRNPRVKHKLKYRKAIIRRKGAVREPKTELTRYRGEYSGIKASVSKSIKIKT